MVKNHNPQSITGWGMLRKIRFQGACQTPFPISSSSSGPQTADLRQYHTPLTGILIPKFKGKHSYIKTQGFHQSVFVYLCACLSLISSTNSPAWILKDFITCKYANIPPPSSNYFRPPLSLWKHSARIKGLPPLFLDCLEQGFKLCIVMRENQQVS